MNHVASSMRSLLLLVSLFVSSRDARAFGAMTRGTVAGRTVILVLELMVRMLEPALADDVEPIRGSKLVDAKLADRAARSMIMVGFSVPGMVTGR